MKELNIAAVIDNLEEVNNFIHDSLSNIECPKRAIMHLDLIVEEIFVNIASYAYPDEVGIATIKSEIREDPLTIILTFIDSGLPYNPLQNEDPDTTLAIEDRQIGGLGIFLVKNMVDSISYKYVDNKNVLTLSKTLA